MFFRERMLRMPKKKKRPARGLYILLLIAVLAILAVGIALALRSGSKVPVPVPVATAPPAMTTAATALVRAETTTTTTTAAEAATEAETEKSLPPGMVSGIRLSFYHATMYLGDPSIMPLVLMEPEDAFDKSEHWESSDESVAIVDESGNITAVGEGRCVIRVTALSNPEVYAEVIVTVEPAPEYRTTPAMSTPSRETTTMTVDEMRKDINVIGGITYVQGVMIVNKTYPLPSSYNPGGLIPEAAQAFSDMRAAASADGIYLFSHSDYRSHWSQVSIYGNYCSQYGQDAADRFSARPGYSEHQTGMTVDVNWPGDAFNGTAEAEWLEKNCAKYGFIIRYPRDKEAYTGYKYESWHIRYVGKEWAAVITASGLSMEEFFDVTSVYPEN